MNILDVAFASGFGLASRFYAVFEKACDSAPGLIAPRSEPINQSKGQLASRQVGLVVDQLLDAQIGRLQPRIFLDRLRVRPARRGGTELPGRFFGGLL